jgi:Ni,Fe-hydrogenase III small subunit
MIKADPATIAALAERLAASGERLLGRSLAIRHVDAGSCGGCEIELRAARNPIHGLAQYGLSFVESPREADILLITGVVTRNMAPALRMTMAAMPRPRFVVAVGDCAMDGGVFKGSAAILGGVEKVLPVDLLIGGCPPAPEEIIEGLLALVEASARPPERAARVERIDPNA